MTIGQRIKKRREELGISQEELAHKIGYKSRSSVNKIELDIYNLQQPKIVAIAKALDVTPMWILGIEDEEQEICEKFADCYGSGTADIVDKLLRLDNEDRLKIAERIEVFLEADKYVKRDILEREIS